MPSHIPEGLRSVTIQLAVNDAAKAIELYAKAFGAIEKARAPDPSGKKIWHAELEIAGSVIFLNDVFPDMGDPTPTKSSMWIYVPDVDAWYARALAAGMKGDMPPTDMFWGDRMAHVSDPFGQKWALATQVKNPTPEEMKKVQDAFVASMKK